MTEFEKQIYEEVLRDHPAVVALRRDLHRHPEIAREAFDILSARIAGKEISGNRRIPLKLVVRESTCSR